MEWDASGFREELTEKVENYNKVGAARLCQELITHIWQSNEVYPLGEAKRILGLLRRKRMFDLMQNVADALIQSGQNAVQVRRQYAQCLIDQGNMTAAIAVLDSLISDSENEPGENAEAHGLKGRAYKQLYFNAKDSSIERRRLNLERAVRCYYDLYDSAPEKHLWHGINVVALLMHGRRAGISLAGFTDPEIIASDILKIIEEKDADSRADYWDFATAAEACMALNQPEQARFWVGRYIQAPYADNFELASTLRQYEEVWQLDMTSELGKLILPSLRAMKFKREGGLLELSVEDLRPENHERPPSKAEHEQVFGYDSYQTYEWLEKGRARCRAVARIGRETAKGLGTGFLIKGSELSKKFGKELVLLTNAHVVSDDPQVIAQYRSLRSHEAVITFELLGNQKYKVGEILWSSPPHELDATIIRLNKAVKIVKDDDIYPLAEVLPVVERTERVYIIGHPAGGTLSISLQDNALLDHQDPPGFIHYRTPTTGGSSGSPVFNRDWNLIGLHHMGGVFPRLNGKAGTYEANQGIWIRAIISAIAKADE